MDDVKVCTICLVMDVRVYNLHSYPLESYYETITGLNPLCDFKLPAYACTECASQLKKFYHFRGKCLRGQAALFGILQYNGKITSQEINNVERENLSLCSNLAIHSVSEDHVYHFTYKEPSVKEEPSEDIINSYYAEFDVKQEDSIDFSPLSSADEDEPLSLHKSNKERKEKTKKARKGSKKDEEAKPECESDEKLDNLEAVATSASTALPRPKRGRPKKVQQDEQKEPKPRRTRNTGGVVDDNIELEEYVTVIRLSEEEQRAEVTSRQTSSNYLNAPYQCNQCYKGFIDTHAWKHHVSKHDPSAGDLECSICKFRFKTKRTLQKHASNHEKKYACKACPYVSKTTTQAKQHQRWHKGVTYKCQYCDEVSTKWTSYLSHVRIKHPSEFICGACGYSFVSKLGLTMHRTMMHKDLLEQGEGEGEGGKAPGPYCEQCDVQFVSEEAWKRHMVTSVKHTKSTDFNNGCRVCGSTFASGEALRLHHRQAHARKRPKNYGKRPSALAWPATCEHCSEVIPNAREYWTHFRRVHPDKNYPIEKNYVCDICGKSFRGNAFLVYHRRTHSERREYECGECGKAFHNRTNLHMHRRTHSDARPHACALCCKAFKCKGALDRHFRSHTGVKPYECEVCGKAFAQSNSRKLHVRTVHLKQPSPYISRSRLERRNKALAQKDAQPPQFLY